MTRERTGRDSAVLPIHVGGCRSVLFAGPPHPRKVSLFVRALFVIAVAVLIGFAVSPLLRADAACTPAPTASVSPSARDDWSEEQVANARLIVTIGDQR